MPVLRSSCAVKLGEVEFMATLDFPTGMLPMEIHILQVRDEYISHKFVDF